MNTPPPSGFARGLMLGGGFAWIYALLVAISGATGCRFEIANPGERGIPLPDTWFHFGLFTVTGAALWFTGRRWDMPGFVAMRGRRPWLVPTVGTLVILPVVLAVLWVLVQ